MEIRAEYDKEIQKNIKDIRDKIYEREQVYFELVASAKNDIEIMRIKTQMYEDATLKILYKQMQYIIERAVPIYYVIVENDKERKQIETLLKRGENN